MRRAALILALIAVGVAPATASAQAPVCAKLTQKKVASAPNRVVYLTRLLPAARHAGFGIGPLLTLEVRALKAGNRAAAARYLGLLANACKRS